MTTSNIYDSNVPRYNAIPEKWEDGKRVLADALKNIISGVNSKQNGYLVEQEVYAGKLLFGNFVVSGSESSENFRTVFSKTVNFGALPNATIKSVSHGINITSTFSLVNIYTSATNQTALKYLPIPYASAITSKNIEIYIDQNNINITTSIDYSSYTICIVVIEYTKET